MLTDFISLPESGYETDFLGFNRRNHSSLRSYYFKTPVLEPRKKESLFFRAANENSHHTKDPLYAEKTSSFYQFTIPPRPSKAGTKNSDETKNSFRFTIPLRLNKSTKVETKDSDETKNLFRFTIPSIVSKSSKARTKNSDETSLHPAQSSKSKANTTSFPIKLQPTFLIPIDKTKSKGMIVKISGGTNANLVPNIDYHYHFHHFEGFDWETLPTLMHFD